jgi:hypothetical protein
MAKNSLLEQLAAELAAKSTKKKKKKTPQYVIEVNGTVMQERGNSKKDVEQAAKALILSNPQVKINLYKLVGPLSAKLPIAGLDTEGKK